MKLSVWLALAASCLVAACGGGHPPFMARSDTRWVSFDLMPDRLAPDVLESFAARARTHGCSTDLLCASYPNMKCYGVAAYCWDKTIAVVALERQTFAIGCLRPMTVAGCDALLMEIMAGEE
ncbi:MAG: hypothetical protein HYV09_32275 [Deltaproteobacteria bacterium]|nr:hypothetical protein [Deltaproteobacteria bacterium]